MKNTLLILSSLLIVACSTPKQHIITSSEIGATCKCEGKGDYTIVMDAGMGNWSLFYQPVFQELKQRYKVCLIDRAGYGTDSVSTNSRDVKLIAVEMENALKNQGINKNIVLIGHSLGGLHVRMFQSLFSEQVAGMVLLDAAHPNQFDRLPKEFYNLLQSQPGSLDKVISLAQKDYLKYSKSKIPTFGIPDSLLSEYYDITTKPEYYYSMKMEVLAFENNLKIIESLNNLGNLPLLVVGSKNSMDEGVLPGRLKDYPFEEHNKTWFELQKDLAKLSENASFIESEQNHYLNVTDSKLVIEKIILFMENQIEK